MTIHKVKLQTQERMLIICQHGNVRAGKIITFDNAGYLAMADPKARQYRGGRPVLPAAQNHVTLTGSVKVT